MKNNEYLESFKIQIVRKVLSSERVYRISKEYNLAKSTIWGWRMKYTPLLALEFETVEKPKDAGEFVEMTNNISERAIKPFVIARKNFLFNFTDNGTRSSAVYFSIQQTARANGFDPRDFVTYLLTKMDPLHKDEALDYLMPWNITKENIYKVVRSN